MLHSCKVSGKEIPPDRPILGEKKVAASNGGNVAAEVAPKCALQATKIHKATQSTVVSDSDADFSDEN